MILQAEISLYPLGTDRIAEGIDTFLERLPRPGVNLRVGNMSTIVEGELELVFEAVRDGFKQVADSNAVVMVLKMSNACPTLGADTGPSPVSGRRVGEEHA
ncbi:MAG: YkoF family thiamine/hydroxymethylpyrimidine-binding protein [Verrucomicrobiota bacterium]|nr:YkoF family thiamine/hydroxymethylpyrimidine-binding protein [Verrucomicrobiota bacterium]MDD8050911.1 YkoF family thiamine/hydroxymethylpyrimidine-binding protein [Verrucomicrobiota bacterium]